MKKKEIDKRERLRKEQYEREKTQIISSRKLAPQLKRNLRQVGCDLPFYDFLDSYSDEFRRIASEALCLLPSLLGIHEVDNDEYFNTNWAKFGAGDLDHVLFNIDDEFAGYGKHRKSEANLQGSTSYFVDATGKVRSIVLIPRSLKSTFVYAELKYVVKIAALLHELGHVHDAENCINIDPIERRFDLIEAESYANCHALNRLADRCLRQTYNMLFEALEKLSSGIGYESEIGQSVLREHPRRSIVDWNDYIDAATQNAMKIR